MISIPKIKISPLPYNDRLIFDVFKSNELVKGPHIGIFENKIADIFGFNHAHTTSSGFAALFLALKSLNFKKASVVVPLISTCHAITNAVLANGYEVIFCKINPDHLSLCEDALAEIYRKKPFDIIIAPSHFGIPAPIESYKKYSVPVIEDACQAFFTRTLIKSSADIMVLSFYPTKQFNCIEGGAILHNCKKKMFLIEDLRYYDHQIKFDGKARYNLRMPNLHAAFGCLLIEKIDEERKSLMNIRDNYIKRIKDKSLLLPKQCDSGIIPWRFLIKSMNSSIFVNLRLASIQTDIDMSRLNNSFDIEEKSDWFQYYQSIPYYSKMSNVEQNIVIKNINEWS